MCNLHMQLTSCQMQLATSGIQLIKGLCSAAVGSSQGFCLCLKTPTKQSKKRDWSRKTRRTSLHQLVAIQPGLPVCAHGSITKHMSTRGCLIHSSDICLLNNQRLRVVGVATLACLLHESLLDLLQRAKISCRKPPRLAEWTAPVSLSRSLLMNV